MERSEIRGQLIDRSRIPLTLHPGYEIATMSRHFHLKYPALAGADLLAPP
jgi:hypothetical protein